MYMATQLMDRKELERQKHVFAALDKNADGRLSKDELIEGYKLIYGDEEEVRREVEQVLKTVDVSRDGFIDYSGPTP